MPEPTSFGKRLRELRVARDWTQDQLAQRSGVPAAMISHFETGVRGAPSAENLVKLANALSVTVDYLLGRSDQPDLASPRAAAAFRRLAGSSGTTIDHALDVVESLARSDQQQRKATDDREGDGD